MLKYQDYSTLQKELNTADQDYKNNEGKNFYIWRVDF